MADDTGPSLADRAVELLARGMDAFGLNGTRLRWRWNQRRRDLGEAGMRAQMVVRAARTPYKMCPECRSLVPRSAWTCPDCGASLSRVRAPGIGRAVANLIPGATAATAMILLVNGAMFLLVLLLPPAVPDEYQAYVTRGFARLMSFDRASLLRYGSGIPALTFEGAQWWRMFTPLFLHAGLFHFFLNSSALLSLGALAEEEYGTERLVVVYLLSGLTGTLLAQYVGGVMTVGASGAICGLLGLLLVHGWKRGGAYGAALRNAMVQNTVIIALMSFLPMIDWRSHLGGFLAGALFGLVVPYRAPRHRAAQIAWTVAAFALVALTAFAFWMMARFGGETLAILLERTHRP